MSQAHCQPHRGLLKSIIRTVEAGFRWIFLKHTKPGKQGEFNASHMRPNRNLHNKCIQSPGKVNTTYTYVDTHANTCMYICAKCMCYAVCPLITVHAFTCPVRVEQNDISRTFRLCLGKTVVSIPLLTISVAGAQIRHATTPTIPYASKRKLQVPPPACASVT